MAASISTDFEAPHLTGMNTFEDFESSLDLARLAKRLVSEDGMGSQALAFQAIEEYKKFFFMMTTVASNDLNEVQYPYYVPSATVDKVWQRHLLDTLTYSQDCIRYGMPNGYLHRHEIAISTPMDETSEHILNGDG